MCVCAGVEVGFSQYKVNATEVGSEWVNGVGISGVFDEYALVCDGGGAGNTVAGVPGLTQFAPSSKSTLMTRVFFAQFLPSS